MISCDISQFHLRAEDFSFVGTGLSRPECVLAEDDGTLWISDDRSAVVRIGPDGSQERIGTMRGQPNGLAMDRAGTLYVANIGDGKVYRLERGGRHEVILEELDGEPLGAVNFVYIDDRDRLWITVSTRTVPRRRAVESAIPDGCILLLEGGSVRRAGSGYCFPNEIRIRADYLYVAETALGGIVRHPIAPDATLGPREAFGPAPLHPGARVDGIAFDAGGNLWVTEITRNALVVITPEGAAHTAFEDPEARILDFPASLAFTGPDRRTVVTGSARMERLASFRVPLPGAPLRHWSRA